MTYSDGDYSDGVVRAHESIIISKRDLTPNEKEACIEACVDSWSTLTSFAHEHYEVPRWSCPVIQDGIRIINTLLDKDASGIRRLKILFKSEEGPDISSNHEEDAKAFIGSLVLHNGSHGNDLKNHLENTADL